MQGQFQALFFDDGSESVIAGEGKTVALAVMAATAATYAANGMDAEATAEGVMAQTDFSLPSEPNKRLRGQDPDTLINEGIPFLIVWDNGRMTIPIGIVRKES